MEKTLKVMGNRRVRWKLYAATLTQGAIIIQDEGDKVSQVFLSQVQGEDFHPSI